MSLISIPIKSFENLKLKDLNKNTIIQIETELLTELDRLNEIKEKITENNKLKGKKIKGFSSNFHNYKRSKHVFSIAEKQFNNLAIAHGLNLEHEHKVKVKDVKGKSRNYYLDFFDTETKICIEINPLFHKTYKVVNIRDKLRAFLLKKKLHIITFNVDVIYRTIKGKTVIKIDVDKSLRVINFIKKAKKSKETLSFYSNNGK